MASGFLTDDGTDFDDIFEPRTTSKRSDVGFIFSDGNDVSNRYEKASSGTPSGNVGYKLSSGQDIGPLFATKGSVVYWDGTLSDVNSYDVFATSKPARAGYIFDSSSENVLRYTDFGTSDIGSWSGGKATASNTEIMFTRLSGNSITNSASSWTSATVEPYFYVSTGSGTSTSTVRVYMREAGNSDSTISKDVTITVTLGGSI